MKNATTSVFWGTLAVVTLLAAGPAKADRFSLGIGVNNGGGGFLSFGVSGGDRRGGHGYSGHRGHCPVVYAPRPIVCMPRPEVCAPAPVVYVPPVQTVVVNSGYWVERETRTWVEGCWIETFDAYGRRCKTWQPGRWEVRRTREWVQQ